MTPKRLRPGMSAAVKTAATPGRPGGGPAGEIAEARSAAWGCGERTAFSTSPPGRQRSAPKASRPSTLAAPSSRGIRAPTAAAAGRRGRRPARRAGIADRGDDLGHSRCSGRARRRAPPRPRSRDGRGIRGQQRRRRHQHAGRADAALRRAMAQEGGAAARVSRGVAEALDRGDRAARDLRRRGQAGADRRAVDQHGAGAAIAGIAADLGAGQAGVLAQHLATGGASGSRVEGRRARRSR